ncbi:MAG TPA: phenylalanine--tRNA ligase beta subunit-related protein [Paludibacteraceae bacterium]|nr:phenylalanine--tRNA ligase beta subunit-related protein [Paludibacteraceae bacterium]HPL94280.1 phenylalanine--tRNA ligase beta subunit-related protein [Paludibacteraceae bacterium]
MNLSVQISSSIASLLPHVVIGLLQCKVSNTSYNDELWTDIEDYSKQFKQTYQLADINQRETIAATREAYRKTGKEPNRYRPSAEALSRRLVKGESLYRISTIVDGINLISVKTGYSIGGFDRDSIIGNSLELGIGQAGEEFYAIGRGLLNIEGLPVYRDEKGPIGTPTSDHERTKISLNTHHLVLIVNGFDGSITSVQQTLDFSRELLLKYTNASNISEKIVPA